MASVRRKSKGRCFRTALIYLLTWCLILNTSIPAVLADALPGMIEGENVIQGTASFNTVGDITTVTTGGAGTIIEYSRFNIDALKTVDFAQPNVASAVLNRIVEANPSLINGTLTSNGRVFIVNPAGIVFGAESAVNVTQLVASGLSMSNDAFNSVMADTDNRMDFIGGNGDVTTEGRIDAGRVYLIGNKVMNRGTIVAPGGLVVMAAGDNIFLAQDGSSVVVQLDADPGAAVVDVENSGLINSDNGKIVLAAGDSFSRAVSNVGTLAASAGTVTAHAARVENRGSITVAADPDTDADGGHIKITAEDFILAGQIDASPGNTDEEPGVLEIDTKTVTIADGANAGAVDTLYEQDIETLGDNGTSVVVNADEAITVEDITDNEINGRYGNIELYAGAIDGSITFDDTTDSISTTLGNIVMEAGSGDIYIGSLETGKDSSDIKPTPGQIVLRTSDGGVITANNLTIRSGWGRAEIDVDASGDLIIKGDVIVGESSDIHNVPNGQDAEAVISLEAGGNVILEGNVGAYAHGIHEAAEDSVTKAIITISSRRPDDGTVSIYGDLEVMAKSSSRGTSEATIEILAWGGLEPEPDTSAVADGDTGQVHVEGFESALAENEAGDKAEIIIGHPLTGVPDLWSTHMGVPFSGNVLDNDPEVDNLTVKEIIDGPDFAESFTWNQDGSFSYTPKEGYVSKLGEDTFFYIATDGTTDSGWIPVTINVVNESPWADSETLTTLMNVPVRGTIADNISDGHNDPLTTDLVTGVEHGALTLNEDGTFIYTPEENYVGVDSFTFSVIDGEIGAEPVQAQVTITVLPAELLNPAPLPPRLEAPEIPPMNYEDYVFLVVFSPDNRYLATASWDGTVRVWEATTGKEVACMYHNNYVESVAFSPDSKHLATACWDTTARLWEVITGREIVRMNHEDEVFSIDFSPDGAYLATACGDRTTRIWEAASGKEVASMPHSNHVSSFAFSPDGKYLATTSWGNTARVWETASGKEVTLMNHEDLLSVAFSPDGKYLATASWDRTARVWEAASGEQVACMNHQDYVFAVSFGPDGKYLATACADRTVRLWEAAGGKEIACLNHQDRVAAFAFSPDGKYIATASWDKTARLWETAGGEEVARINHEDPVSSVAFSPDGKYLATASQYARVLEATSGEEIARMTVTPDNYRTIPPQDRDCKVLVKWVADNLGYNEDDLQTWMVKSRAFTRHIHICVACEMFKRAATILQDAEGLRIAALAQIINEFASGDAPMSEEQEAQIAEEIESKRQTNEQYALAGEYLDALVNYVGMLNSAMGFSRKESLDYAMDNYVYAGQLAVGENISVAHFVEVKLAAFAYPADGETIPMQASRCPTLLEWAADNLGTDEGELLIQMSGALARPVQPCKACEQFKQAATILQDAEGTRIAALAQIINKFVSGDAPMSEELEAQIAAEIEIGSKRQNNKQYALAGEYLDAIAAYVGILSSGMGFSPEESVEFATNNYIRQLADSENVNLAAYVAARLVAPEGI